MSHLSSMTAFAQASAVQGGYLISWELRSVNHRYLESQFRLPDTLRAMNSARTAAQATKAGKVDVTLKLEPEASGKH